MAELSRRSFFGALAAFGAVAAIPKPIRKAALARSTSTVALSSTAGLTIKAGDVFTIAGVYGIDPLSQRTLPTLKQFRVIGSHGNTLQVAQAA